MYVSYSERVLYIIITITYKLGENILKKNLARYSKIKNQKAHLIEIDRNVPRMQRIKPMSAGDD